MYESRPDLRRTDIDAGRSINLALATRGIVPLGGATFRLPLRLGARGASWLLGAQDFDARQALEAGLVTEVVEPGRQLRSG